MSNTCPVRPRHTHSDLESGRCDRGCEGGLEDGVVICGKCDHKLVPGEVFPVGESQDNVDGGDAEIHAEAEQEVERIARLPSYQPTQSEYDDHCVTHSPYRPWCRHCVEGRGQEFGHFKRRSHDPSRVPLVAFDYAGLSDKREIVGLEFDPEDESATRVLVVSIRTADDLSVCVFGHVVPCKGVDEARFAVDCLVGDILWTGYTSVMLKSDNKPAILKLLIESLCELRVYGLQQVLSENPSEYDPQGNGAAESAVKAWKGMFRTQKSALEERLGVKVPVRHPLTAWIAKWAGEVLVWSVKGHDGISAYQRVRGKPFHTRLAALGKKVRYKFRPREAVGDSRWHDGVFLGIDRRTGQYIVYGVEGVKHARTILRLPDAETNGINLLYKA